VQHLLKLRQAPHGHLWPVCQAVPRLLLLGMPAACTIRLHTCRCCAQSTCWQAGEQHHSTQGPFHTGASRHLPGSAGAGQATAAGVLNCSSCSGLYKHTISFPPGQPGSLVAAAVHRMDCTQPHQPREANGVELRAMPNLPPTPLAHEAAGQQHLANRHCLPACQAASPNHKPCPQ
jgi:hypothetical protein